jgi:hypothetical protein
VRAARRRDEEAQITIAWWTALLHRQRVVPPLDRLLRPQTAPEMLERAARDHEEILANAERLRAEREAERTS